MIDSSTYDHCFFIRKIETIIKLIILTFFLQRETSLKERLALLSAEVEKVYSYNGNNSEVDSLVYSQLDVESPPAHHLNNVVANQSQAVEGSPKPKQRSVLRAELGRDRNDFSGFFIVWF